jgi:hypothetical protein
LIFQGKVQPPSFFLQTFENQFFKQKTTFVFQAKPLPRRAPCA